jgi:hypothetical protein
MVIPRTVNARLIERFLFNFRVKPEALAQHLPATFLRPLEINGWSVVSFCVLRLDRLMIWPIPRFLGYSTVSCAYRCGIIDVSSGHEEPSVYVTDRLTDLPVVSRLSPWVFADTLPTIRPNVARIGDEVRLDLCYLDNQPVFTATAKALPAGAGFQSEVFSSIDEFASFIKLGVSSYTPSIYGDALAKVDLHKEEPVYEPVNATIDFSSLDGVWPDTGMVFDSAVRAAGGRYTWTYRGLAALNPAAAPLRTSRPLAKVFRGLRPTQAVAAGD